MSYYVDEEGNQRQFASNSGYAQLGDWIDGLDLGAYRDLISLYEHGYSSDRESVAAELKQAVKTDSPDSADVLHTAEALLEILQADGPKEIGITNGIV